MEGRRKLLHLALSVLVVVLVADWFTFGLFRIGRFYYVRALESPMQSDRWLFSDCIESLKNTWAGVYDKAPQTPAHKPRLIAFTVADHVEEGLEVMQKLTAKYGIELRVQIVPLLLGKAIGHGRGFGHKLNLERDIVIAEDIHDDDVVMFVDAFDVIFAPTSAEEILAKFFETGCEVVFAAEYFCWPRPEMKERYPEVTTPYRFINSGLYIGYARTIRRYLGNCGRPFDTLSDDQAFYTHVYFNPPPSKKMCIDYKNDLFMCMGGALQDAKLLLPSETGNSKVEVENVKTKGRPKIMHFNGGNLKPHVVSWYQQMYGIELDPADGSPLSYPGTKIVALLIAVLGASSSYWYCRKQRRRHVSYPP
eukprot:tig00000881_g5217.t1